MVPFWKEAMEMVLDVEPGMSVSHCACRSFVMCLLQTRTLQEYQMFPSSKRLLNCSTDSFISVSSSLALGCRQWYAPFECALTPISRAGQVEKYENGAFGICPRVYCSGCNIVPCGRSDLPGIDTVKLYCPNCNDIYSPPSSRFQGVDGLTHSPLFLFFVD